MRTFADSRVVPVRERGVCWSKTRFLLLLLAGLSVLNSFTVGHTPTLGVVVDKSSPALVDVAKVLVEETLVPLSHTLGFQLLEVLTALDNTTSFSLSAAVGDVQGLVALGGCEHGSEVLEEMMKNLLVLRILLGDCVAAPRHPEYLSLNTSKGGAGNEHFRAELRQWVVLLTSGRQTAKGNRQSVTARLAPSLHNLKTLLSYNLTRHQPFRKTATQFSERVVRAAAVGQSYLQKVKQEARKLLNGHVLTVAIKHRPPYVWLVKDKRTIVDSSGILIELLNSFANTYNFTYKLKLPDDDQWGALKDGTWTGMVGEVYRKEVEMALGPTSITEAREKAIDFTVPFDYEPWDILIPESLVIVDLTAYLFPFAGLVWVGVLMSMVVVGMTEWLLGRGSQARVLLYPRRHATSTYSFFHYVMDTFGCLVSQSNRQPQTASVRMLAGWWWIFSVVVVASYSSKLISSLTVRFTEPPVKSLQDLVESRKLLWTYLNNSAMEEVFKNSAPDTLFGKVGQLHKDKPGLLVNGFDEGVAAVRSKKFAYFEDNSWLEFAVADDLATHGECRMSVVRDHFFSTRFGIILQPSSPYRDAFSLEILLMIQSGLMSAWKKEFWPVTHCVVKKNAKKPLRPLNLLDMVGTFVLLVAGFALGAIALFLELVVMRYHDG
ncbi:glutamate receptor U1-like isoform X2 [Homarus americanus]|nr:glutamate receptor U1-like isoform X2 [Homarus americanus]